MATNKAKLSVRWKPDEAEPASPGAVFRYSDNPQVEIDHASVGRVLALTYDAETGAGGFTLKQPSGRQLTVVWDGDPDGAPSLIHSGPGVPVFPSDQTPKLRLGLELTEAQAEALWSVLDSERDMTASVIQDDGGDPDDYRALAMIIDLENAVHASIETAKGARERTLETDLAEDR